MHEGYQHARPRPPSRWLAAARARTPRLRRVVQGGVHEALHQKLLPAGSETRGEGLVEAGEKRHSLAQCAVLLGPRGVNVLQRGGAEGGEVDVRQRRALRAPQGEPGVELAVDVRHSACHVLRLAEARALVGAELVPAEGAAPNPGQLGLLLHRGLEAVHLRAVRRRDPQVKRGHCSPRVAHLHGVGEHRRRLVQKIGEEGLQRAHVPPPRRRPQGVAVIGALHDNGAARWRNRGRRVASAHFADWGQPAAHAPRGRVSLRPVAPGPPAAQRPAIRWACLDPAAPRVVGP